MSQSISDPKEQIRFAQYLIEVSSFLERKHVKFLDSVAAVEVICRDEKYVTFRRNVMEAMDSLATFEKATQRYAQQLEQKGKLGQRYLEN